MPTETKEPPKDQLTDEDLKKMIPLIGESLFGKDPAEEASEKAKEIEKKESPKVEEKSEEKVPETKIEEKQGEKVEEKPNVDPEKAVGQVVPTAEEIADAVASRMTPKQETKAKESDDKLTEEDKHDREILAFMAKDNPGKYGKIVEEFDAFVQLEKAYKAKWEKEHPGETFYPADDQHKEFYDENEPEFVQVDFDRASTRLEARKEAQEFVERERKEDRKKEAIRTLPEKLKANRSEIVTSMLSSVDADLGKLDLTQKTLRDQDPIAEAAVRTYLPDLIRMTDELVKAFDPQLQYDLDINNPVHQQLLYAAGQFESEIVKGDKAAQTLADGRQFATADQWNKMSKEQKDKHWTIWFEPKEISKRLVRDFASRAKEDLGIYRKAANGSAPKETPKPEEKSAEKPKPETDKKTFPNTADGATSVAGKDKEVVFDASLHEVITKGLFPE